MIEEQKAQEIIGVTVYLLSPTEDEYNAASITPNVGENKNEWFNEWMSMYYGVNSITGIER